MGEVSKLTGLPPHVLRNWENIYPDLRPKKNSAGNRAYKEHEVELIFKIKELLEVKKYTPEGVRRVLKGEKADDYIKPTPPIPVEVKKDLNEVRVFLNELLEKL